MAGFHLLCRQLAEGTASQKRRAWKSLVSEGELWRGCQEAAAAREPVAGAAALELLAASYWHLRARWDRSPVVEAQWGGPGVVEEQIGTACRLVAAAAAAAAARCEGSDLAMLGYWALRSAGADGSAAGSRLQVPGSRFPAAPTPNLQPLNLEPSSLPPLEAEARVRHCYRRLCVVWPQWLPRLAAAQDSALSLLRAGSGTDESSPSMRRLRVPVLLARGQEGFLGWLWLERQEGGFGQFFQVQSTLLDPLQPDLRLAVEEAWRHVLRVRSGEWGVGSKDAADGTSGPSFRIPHSAFRTREAPHSAEGVRWWLSDLPRETNGAPTPVAGASLQAAAVVGLTLLLEGRPYDPACAISATVAEDGTLGEVVGLAADGSAKLWAARRLQPQNGPAVVVVSGRSRLSETAAAEWEGRGVRVVAAATVAEALPLASGVLTQLCRVVEGEASWVLQDASRRMGRELPDWEALDQMWVPIRVARGLRPKLTQQQYEELERRKTAGDYRGIHAMEKQRQDLRGEETQRHLPRPRPTGEWADLRERVARILLLGDPGYGKTMLLWHEVARRNREALAAARAQVAAACDLRFAVFVRAVDLAQELPGTAGADSLLDVLAARLTARHALNDEARDLVRAKLANGDCLIAVDALDEVPYRGPVSLRARLDAALAQFARHCPRAALLLTSRLAGYAGSPFPLAEEDELELLAFNERQIEDAVERWFADDAPTARTVWGHVRDQANVRPVLRCPLFLRLACHAVEQARRDGRPLPRWERRSDLYETLLANAIALWSERAAPRPDRDQRSVFRRFAAEVAERLWRKDPSRTLWDEAEVGKVVQEARRRYPALNRRAPGAGPRALLDDLCAAGIMAPAGPDGADTPLMFTHRSFGEYLTACALADRLQDNPDAGDPRQASADETWTYLERKAWDPDWHPVLIFLAGRIEHPVLLLDRVVSVSDGLGRRALTRDPLRGYPASPNAGRGEKVASSLLPSPSIGRGARGEGGAFDDDFFRHRLALAALCLPEISPGIRSSQPQMVDRITTAAFSLWWERRRDNPEIARLTRITGALTALGQLNGRVSGTPLLEWLCQRLRDPDRLTRGAAAEAVIHIGSGVEAGGSGPGAVLSCVAALLAERAATTRKVALEMVMGLGPTAATPPILGCLADLLCDSEAWFDATLAIRCLGNAAATPDFLGRVSELLQDTDGNIRQAAARAVGGVGRAAATDEILARLRKLLREEHRGVRQAALEAIRGLEHAAATDEMLTDLSELLCHDDWNTRQGAALAVRAMGRATATPESLGRLAELLGDASIGGLEVEGCRLQVERDRSQPATCNLQPATVLEAEATRWMGVLRDPDVRGRQTAAEALERLMAQGVRVFVGRNVGWDVRHVADLVRD